MIIFVYSQDFSTLSVTGKNSIFYLVVNNFFLICGMHQCSQLSSLIIQQLKCYAKKNMVFLCGFGYAVPKK